MNRVTKLTVVLAVALSLVPALSAADDRTLQDQLAKADQLYRAGQYEDATREYKKAVESSGDKSHVALIGLAKAYRSIGAWEMCIEKTARATEVASNNPQRSDAHWLAGLCYTEQRDKDGSYAKAEKELQTALQLAPENREIHVSLGSLLMREGRDAEGIAQINIYLQTHPSGPLAQIAQSLVNLPDLARLEFMPDFTLKTVDDRLLRSNDLTGKVVLIDFWAPWCAPCRAAIPHLRSLLKQYSRQQLQIISVCGDEKEEVWYRYIQENAMDWPQYYDRYATMRRLFRVTNYPTYVIIDGNGIIRTKVIGIGDKQLAFVEEELQKVIEKEPLGTKAGSEANADKKTADPPKPKSN